MKDRLEFLLKYSTNIEDFKNKAQELNLHVDFSVKYVKYKLLDREQKRNTRDSTLSQKDRYSLKNIEERISKNEIVYPLESIKNEYENLKE
ncbi:relaxase/mobilization nuclease domain-containing protein [Streptococcus oralis]|nr:relaxase/mobilization nuclease domain-containing protein [Streptococcus oralis]